VARVAVRKWPTEELRRAAVQKSIQKYRAKNIEKVRAWRRAAHARHREQYNVLNRRYKLRATYGISEAEYAEMLAKQNGGCAICGGKNPSGKKLAVDHCHSKKTVRGLLCSRCNTCLGQARDSVETLRAAIAYLERNA
jgi:hypothetical protein